MSYPPGVTQWHIDYYAGGYDEPREKEEDEAMNEEDLKALPELITMFHNLGDMAHRNEAITWEQGIGILYAIQRYHELLEYACVVARDTEPKF